MAEQATRSPNPNNGFFFNNAALRVKDPKASIEFYEKHFGMQLMMQVEKPGSPINVYTLATNPEGYKLPYDDPAHFESAAKHHCQMTSSVLRLTDFHADPKDADFKYHNGNSDPRGFGHIGFIVDDVDAFCDVLIAEGVRFQKKPTEGRMRDIAFCLDPDGYWIEILSRSKVAPPTAIVGKPSFQQVMIRIKDPKISVPFYEKNLGCTIVCEHHFPEAKFSLYFMGTLDENDKLPVDPKSP